MYQVVRDSLSVSVALSSGVRDARTRNWDPQAERTTRWNEIVFVEPARRNTLARRVARSIFHLGIPVLRPVAWRTRTFMTAPMHAEMSRLTGRLESQSTLLSAQLHQTESLISSMAESLQRVNVELEEVRGELAQLREEKRATNG